MNAYRLIAMAVTTCAAGLSLTACSAGITTAGPSASRSPATSRTASSPAAAASHPSPASPSPADTVHVDARIGSFPIPHGAQVLFSGACGKQLIIDLISVTPSQASRFYIAALPRAGYKITSNNGGTAPGVSGSFADIGFTGHGYKGTISATSDLGALSSTGPSTASLPSNFTKNFVTITLTPPGATGTSCGG